MIVCMLGLYAVAGIEVHIDRDVAHIIHIPVSDEYAVIAGVHPLDLEFEVGHCAIGTVAV